MKQKWYWENQFKLKKKLILSEYIIYLQKKIDASVVTYKEDKKLFTDSVVHWAKENIQGAKDHSDKTLKTETNSYAKDCSPII